MNPTAYRCLKSDPSCLSVPLSAVTEVSEKISVFLDFLVLVPHRDLWVVFKRQEGLRMKEYQSHSEGNKP